MRLTLILGTILTLCTTSLPVPEPDILVADFEGKDYGDWGVEGTAFIDDQCVRAFDIEMAPADPDFWPVMFRKSKKKPMSRAAFQMPDGTPFDFWDDSTVYSRVYHVSCEHPAASDKGPGTQDRPFATIGRAAELLEPGEKVVVHGGVYRECVHPARGGEAPDRMIAYEAAAGEKVVVRGSEHWTPTFAPSKEWRFSGLPDGATVWTATLPAEWFIGYNPFMARNFPIEYPRLSKNWSTEELQRFMLRRGMIFADGKPLQQVFRARELGKTDGAFWVEDPGLRIHLRLWDDANPKDVWFEVTAREQTFAPIEHGLGYIRVSGFRFQYAADGVPVPQRAMVSATRGHHWIIEDNRISWANACGIDVGNETWNRPKRESSDRAAGHHIIRRNRVFDCGVCGIAAVGNNARSLVEDNLIERIGGKIMERVWETAGMKFHYMDSALIRGNVFRHIRQASGLWLDVMNRNCRVTRNVFADIESINGGIYLEVSHDRNVIDHNIFWGIQAGHVLKPDFGPYGSGHAIKVDSGERTIIANNLFGNVQDGYAVAIQMVQYDRIVNGRTGLGRRHKILNNVIVMCPKRILFARAKENQSDGNLFEQRDDRASFCIKFPAPQAMLTLDAWQEYYGFDRNSRQAPIEADFDAETLVLTLKVDGEIPLCDPVEELHEGTERRPPGPVELKADRREYRLIVKQAITR